MLSTFCKASFFTFLIQHHIFLKILHFPLRNSFESALLRWLFTTPTQGEGALGEGEFAIVELGNYYSI